MNEMDGLTNVCKLHIVSFAETHHLPGFPMSDFSTALFAKPSFLEGVGRILDFGDMLTEYNRSITPEQADLHAITSDVRAISNDFWTALQQFKQEVDVKGITKKKEK